MTVVDAESRFHVLAVDDSVIDRKLIEMLLKTSSYQGEPALCLPSFSFVRSQISRILFSVVSDHGGFGEQGAGGPGAERRRGARILLPFLLILLPSPPGSHLTRFNLALFRIPIGL